MHRRLDTADCLRDRPVRLPRSSNRLLAAGSPRGIDVASVRFDETEHTSSPTSKNRRNQAHDQCPVSPKVTYESAWNALRLIDLTQDGALLSLEVDATRPHWLAAVDASPGAPLRRGDAGPHSCFFV